jgi:hypothetical protein
MYMEGATMLIELIASVLLLRPAEIVWKAAVALFSPTVSTLKDLLLPFA